MKSRILLTALALVGAGMIVNMASAAADEDQRFAGVVAEKTERSAGYEAERVQRAEDDEPPTPCPYYNLATGERYCDVSRTPGGDAGIVHPD